MREKEPRQRDTGQQVLLEFIAAVVAERAQALLSHSEGKPIAKHFQALLEIERPRELKSEEEADALLRAAAALDHIQRLESAGAPSAVTAPMLESFRQSHDARWVDLLLAHREELSKAFRPLHRQSRR